MLWRFRDLFDGGQDLLRAEAQLAVRKMRRSLAAVLLLAAASGVALIGLLTLLAGVGVALAREWGWIWSLSTIGGVLLLVGLIASFVLSAKMRAVGEPEIGPGPKERSRQSKEQMTDAVDPTVSKEEARGGSASRPHRPSGESENPLEDLKSAAVDFATRNPMAVAGAAFAAVSLIGPGRTIRLVSRGLTVASIAASVLGKLGEDDGPEETRRPTPCPDADARPGPGEGPRPRPDSAAPGPRSGRTTGQNGHHQRPGASRPSAMGGTPGFAGSDSADDPESPRAVPTRDAPPDRFRVTGT